MLLLQQFKNILEKLFQYSQEQSKLVCIVTILFVTILSITSLPKLDIQFDMATLANQQSSTSQNELFDEFNKAQTATVLHINKKNNERLNELDLCTIKEKLKQMGLETNVSHIEGIFSYLRVVETDKKLLFKNKLILNCDSPNLNNFPLKTIKNDLFLSDWASPDEKALSFNIKFSEKRWDKKSSIPKKVYKMEEWLRTNLNQFEFFTNGPATLILQIKQILKKDIFINVILVVIFSLLYFLVFKSVKGVIIQFFSLSIAAVILASLYPLFGFYLDPLNAALFIILFIASAEDFLFISFDRQVNPDSDFRESFKKFLLPGLLTSLTTIIGFGSLAISNIDSIKIFGLMAVVGAAIEWLTVFFIVPAFLKEIPPLQKWVRKSKANFISHAINKLIQVQVPRYLVIALMIPFFLGPYLATKLEINDSSLNFFHKNHPIHKNSQTLLNERDWGSSFHVKFPLKNKEQSQELKHKLLKNKNVVKVISFYDYFDEITKGLTPAARSYIFTNMKYNEDSRNLVNRNNFIFTVYLKSKDLLGASKIINQVDKFCQSVKCKTFGRMVLSNNYTQEVLDTFLKSFYLSISLITLTIAALSYLSATRMNFRILISSLWGPFTILSIFYLLNLPLNFVTCIFISVLVGIAGDNAIQYILYENNEELYSRLPKIAPGSFYICLWGFFGSLSFTFSQLKFTQILGMIFALGFILGLFGDYYLLRALILPRSKTK